jgi:hypothetical protein
MQRRATLNMNIKEMNMDNMLHRYTCKMIEQLLLSIIRAVFLIYMLYI